MSLYIDIQILKAQRQLIVTDKDINILQGQRKRISTWDIIETYTYVQKVCSIPMFSKIIRSDLRFCQ